MLIPIANQKDKSKAVFSNLEMSLNLSLFKKKL